MATQKKPSRTLSLPKVEAMGILVVITLVTLWLRSPGDSDNSDVVDTTEVITVIDEERDKRRQYEDAKEVPEDKKVADAQLVVHVEQSAVQTIEELREEFSGLETDFMNKYHPSIDQEIFYASLAMKESSGDKKMVGSAGERGYFQIMTPALTDLNSEFGRGLTLEDFQGRDAARNAVWAFSAYCNRYVPQEKKRDIKACLNVWNKGPGAWDRGRTYYVRWVDEHYHSLEGSSVYKNTAYINPLPNGYKLKRGVSNDHEGFDLACPCGKPILATSGGKVIRARRSDSGWGKHIAISDGTYVWLYAHLSEGNVGTGDIVSQGQQIGLVGDTGHSTGCHLHLECWTISEWNKDRAGKVAHPVKKLLWQ